MTKRDKAHRLLALLVEHFPPPYPVSLVVGRTARDEFGYTAFGRGRFEIRAASSLPWRELADTVLHEYAHVLAWPRARVERHHPIHSDEWAIAYGRVYRWFHDEDGFQLLKGDFAA